MGELVVTKLKTKKPQMQNNKKTAEFFGQQYYKFMMQFFTEKGIPVDRHCFKTQISQMFRSTFVEFSDIYGFVEDRIKNYILKNKTFNFTPSEIIGKDTSKLKEELSKQLPKLLVLESIKKCTEENNKNDLQKAKDELIQKLNINDEDMNKLINQYNKIVDRRIKDICTLNIDGKKSYYTKLIVNKLQLEYQHARSPEEKKAILKAAVNLIDDKHGFPLGDVNSAADRKFIDLVEKYKNEGVIGDDKEFINKDLIYEKEKQMQRIIDEKDRKIKDLKSQLGDLRYNNELSRKEKEELEDRLYSRIKELENEKRKIKDELETTKIEKERLEKEKDELESKNKKTEEEKQKLIKQKKHLIKIISRLITSGIFAVLSLFLLFIVSKLTKVKFTRLINPFKIANNFKAILSIGGVKAFFGLALYVLSFILIIIAAIKIGTTVPDLIKIFRDRK